MNFCARLEDVTPGCSRRFPVRGSRSSLNECNKKVKRDGQFKDWDSNRICAESSPLNETHDAHGSQASDSMRTIRSQGR